MTIIQDSFIFSAPRAFCENCGRELSNPISVALHIGPICRSKTGAKDMNTSDKIDMRQWGTRFDYNAITGPAHCYVKVHNCTVICTEAPDNDGMSISNAAEIVARSVCHAYNIPMDRLVWIEHYTHVDLDIGDTFDRVEFTVTRGYSGQEFINPKWSPLDNDVALKMLE